jgi:hypothetical protein
VYRVSEVPAVPDRTRTPSTTVAAGRSQSTSSTTGVVVKASPTADAPAESFLQRCERLGIDQSRSSRPTRSSSMPASPAGARKALGRGGRALLTYEAITGATGASVRRPADPVAASETAGGGLHCFGVLAAVFEAQRSGQRQVVDVAMVDGVLSLYSVYYAMSLRGTTRRSARTSSTVVRRRQRLRDR